MMSLLDDIRHNISQIESIAAELAEISDHLQHLVVREARKEKEARKAKEARKEQT